MIVDKNIEEASEAVQVKARADVQPPKEDGGKIDEDLDQNPLINTYEAARRVLESLHEDPNDPNSPRLFKTVKIDNGQFNRIVRGKINEEIGIAFPAVFVRFVNVRYLVAQQRVGEGRATMRLRFILNNLNNSDDGMESMGFRVFQQINKAIQKAKNTESALNERCNLQYFDMPETQDDGLQAFWVDYEIWFRDYSGFKYRDYVDKYLVFPPYTNHSDAPEHDTEGHGDHDVPIDDVVHIIDGKHENQTE